MFGLIPYEQKRTQLTGRRPRDIFDYFFNDEGLLPTFVGEFSSFRADIKETDEKYMIEAEMPGVNKKDISIDLQEDVLTISAEKKEEKSEEKDSYVRKERRYGSFSRSFRVENINKENIHAALENGILKIELPKHEPAVEAKHTIDIN